MRLVRRVGDAVDRALPVLGNIKHVGAGGNSTSNTVLHLREHVRRTLGSTVPEGVQAAVHAVNLHRGDGRLVPVAGKDCRHFREKATHRNDRAISAPHSVSDAPGHRDAPGVDGRASAGVGRDGVGQSLQSGFQGWEGTAHVAHIHERVDRVGTPRYEGKDHRVRAGVVSERIERPAGVGGKGDAGYLRLDVRIGQDRTRTDRPERLAIGGEGHRHGPLLLGSGLFCTGAETRQHGKNRNDSSFHKRPGHCSMRWKTAPSSQPDTETVTSPRTRSMVT